MTITGKSPNFFFPIFFFFFKGVGVRWRRVKVIRKCFLDRKTFNMQHKSVIKEYWMAFVACIAGSP